MFAHVGLGEPAGHDAIFRLSDKSRKIARWSSVEPGVKFRPMASDLKRLIGLRIRAERLARGMTQEQLAERVTRTVETISNIERGRAFPGLETVEELAAALGVPVVHLFKDVDGTMPTGRRVELEARMMSLLGTLTDADFEIAIKQVEALAQGRQRSSK